MYIDYKDAEAIRIDDFTLKKHKYETILINLRTNRVIEVIDIHDIQVVIKALNKFYNLQIISTDRGIQYNYYHP